MSTTTTATVTTAGLNLLAAALMDPTISAAITYVAVGTGCGTLTTALTNGSSYTALTVASGIPATLAGSQALTLISTDGTTTQSVTVTSAGAPQGATTIPVNSFTASASFPSGTGVCTTPAASDTALANEALRNPVSSTTSGTAAGEALITNYVPPNAASGNYVEVGFFGGTASATLDSGTLVMRGVGYWSHTYNQDSATLQIDTTL